MIDINKKLYIRGFLLTNNKSVSESSIGVDWGYWNKFEVSDFDLWMHPLQTHFLSKKEDVTVLLIGHAYNPFTMEYEEQEITEQLARKYRHGEGYREYLDQLTGMFFVAAIVEDHVLINTDCSGLLGSYYALVDGYQYYSSFAQMIADVCKLKEEEYVTKLKSSKLFHYYGLYLPGDMSPYAEIKRVIPNTEVSFCGSFTIHRFFPSSKYSEAYGSDYYELVREAADIIYRSLLLVLEKWPNAAISLTGGIDSQTTLSCSRDMKGYFHYFSYASLPRERIDAEAACHICNSLDLEHTIFEINSDGAAYPSYSAMSDLIKRQHSYLGAANENDVCKRIVLANEFKYDIEVKSWVSEIVRASRYKMYSTQKLPKKITPRLLTTMYKIFGFNRGDVKKTDAVFRRYMTNTGLDIAIERTGYPWSEFFVWEIVFGGWGSLALSGEHKISNDITVPFNNRKLLDLMFRTPLKKRIDDELHKDIIAFSNKKVSELGVHVVNGNETKARQIAEKVYFEVHSRFPW